MVLHVTKWYGLIGPCQISGCFHDMMRQVTPGLTDISNFLQLCYFSLQHFLNVIHMWNLYCSNCTCTNRQRPILNKVNDWLKRFTRFPQVFSPRLRHLNVVRREWGEAPLCVFAVFGVAGPQVPLTLGAAVVRPTAGRTHEVRLLQYGVSLSVSHILHYSFVEGNFRSRQGNLISLL